MLLSRNRSVNKEAKSWNLHSDSSTHWGDTANHMCKVGAWRRWCPSVVVTNRAWQSGNSRHLRLMREWSAVIIIVHSKGTRNLKSDTVWSCKTVSDQHGGMGWGLEVTPRKFKMISNTMLTHFRKPHPIYLGAQDEDLEVNMFPLFPHLPHLIYQQSCHFPPKYIANPSTSLSPKVLPC